ncbi:hypothetical protein BDZ45DRAFT_431487 [Acephala macrosclerotiorum]|nr:hypothetical protein BDZ45DRAFT_431487 [Acephala macrosclerotiorum]
MTLEIKIPLEAWERTLLNDVKQKFVKSIHQQSQKTRPQVIETFRHLAWAVDVENVLREGFDDAKTEIFHQENHHRIWQIVREGLSTRGAYHAALSSYSCHSRLGGLLRENPKLPQTFSDSNVLHSLDSNISLVPADQDIEYWEVITDLRNFLLFGGDDSDSQEEARFDEIEPVEVDDTTAREILEKYFKGFQDRAAAQLVPADEFPNIDTDEDLMSLMEKFDVWILTQEVASLGRRSSTNSNRRGSN